MSVMTELDEKHPLQYAFVLHTAACPHDPVLNGTEQLTDEQVFAALAARDKDSLGREVLNSVRHQLEHPGPYMLRTERYNRCPTCEQWSPCDVRESISRSAQPAP